MIYYISDMTLGETLKCTNTLETIVSEGRMVFDFSKMSNFDPLPMFIMDAMMRSYSKQFPEIPFRITEIDTAGKSYVGTMGFFKYVSTSLEVGKMPGEAQGSSNYIPITPIVVDELQKSEYEQGNYMTLGDLIEFEEVERLKLVEVEFESTEGFEKLAGLEQLTCWMN